MLSITSYKFYEYILDSDKTRMRHRILVVEAVHVVDCLFNSTN